MILKPKATTFNPKARLYRRYTDIATATNQTIYFKTLADNKYWLFNAENKAFEQFLETPSTTATIKEIAQNSTEVYGYYSYAYKYTQENSVWAWRKQSVGLPFSLNNVSVIGKYQTNKYYYICDFDYVIKGAIEDGKTQNIKGNIMPIVSLNIKFFNDEINLQDDDLVVVEERLYSVENPVTDHKHFPRDYKIHYATLNSIL